MKKSDDKGKDFSQFYAEVLILQNFSPVDISITSEIIMLLNTLPRGVVPRGRSALFILARLTKVEEQLLGPL